MFLTFPSWPLGRADPECVLGHLLKILFKNDDFMNTVRTELTLFPWKIKALFLFFLPQKVIKFSFSLPVVGE